MEERKGAEFWLGIGASALVVVGALIPWIMITGPGDPEFSRGLPHHYWQLALLAGAVSFIAAARARWAYVTAVACFLVVGACLAGTMSDILKFCGSLDGFVGCGSEGFLKVGASPGWYLAAIAAVAGVCIHGYSLFRMTPSATQPATAASGPTTTVDGASPPAWHPDPTGRYDHRYWDGSRWTEHVSQGGAQVTDPNFMMPNPPA